MGHSELNIPLDRDSGISLKNQLEYGLINRILAGRISAELALPSTRKLSVMLSVSRNTVIQVYESLISKGYLTTLERKGYFINKAILPQTPEAKQAINRLDGDSVWKNKISTLDFDLKLVQKPRNWRSYEYPFIYGHTNEELFPYQDWCFCSKLAGNIDFVREWGQYLVDYNESELVEEIRCGLINKFGIYAEPGQIMITMGSQHALYLICRLLVGKNTQVGIEDPGYMEARKIFSKFGSPKFLQVDKEGLVCDENLRNLDMVFTTPANQYPTTVRLSDARRKALLKTANEYDFLILEDHFENDLCNFCGSYNSLKSQDQHGRVIFISSFSKTLAPGLRMGYLIADEMLVEKLKDYSRFILRHPPTNLQKTLAIYLKGGYHQVHLKKLLEEMKTRQKILCEAVDKYLPDFQYSVPQGGTSLWLKGEGELNSGVLYEKALERGVIIEPGSFFFSNSEAGKNFFRLGFGSIKKDRIPAGIRLLAEIIG